VNRIRIFAAVLPALLLLAGGQSARAQNSAPAPQEAIGAADQFLTLIDHGQYDESWDACAQAIKNSITKPSWDTVLSLNRRRFGVLGSRKLVSAQTATSLAGSPDGHYAVMRYRSSFTAGKTSLAAIEVVTLSNEKGKWLGYQYSIKDARKKR
jgi:hypothetical protein